MDGARHGTLQLWGGIECTVNRVADRYFDQLQFSGHHERIADLERIAELSHAALHRIGRCRVVLADVRRRGNGGDSVHHGSAGDLQRVGEIGGPVV